MSPVTLFRHGACILYLSKRGDIRQASGVEEKTRQGESRPTGDRVRGGVVCGVFFIHLSNYSTYLYLPVHILIVHNLTTV